MELATRYRWSIFAERVGKRIKRVLKKAAPRFELGIKDLQSSALPLGHAAGKENQNLSTNRISNGNQNVLFLSNGHGEDLIALRVLEELHGLHPQVSFEVLPLVGQGKSFDRAVSEKWLIKSTLLKSLPSGGFSNQSIRGLFADLFSGLLVHTWNQWKYIRRAAANGRLIVAVGDILPLFFAWASGGNYAFIGTPKSDYTWISGPGSALSDYYHRLKGTEWDPWEYSLMKSSRCKIVALRDQVSARSLRRHGIQAHAPGNPMMDALMRTDCPDSLKPFRRLILLCGSRMPEALRNFQNLLNSIDQLVGNEPLAIFVVTGGEPSLEILQSCLVDAQYINCRSSTISIGQKAVWKKGRVMILIGPGCFANWASWAEIGLSNAGTATEQIVGLGIPCLSLPGNGPQFTYGFAKRQSRLLGGAVMPCNNPSVLARRVNLLLNSEKLRHELVGYGEKRMGLAGGSLNIAVLISQLLLSK